MAFAPIIKDGTFHRLVLSGTIHPELIDNYVAYWHRTKDANSNIFQFLGLTETEYSIYVRSLEEFCNMMMEKIRHERTIRRNKG